MIRILGAGLAGLSAAINLKKAGEDVLVLEKLKSVGKQIHPNYQALRIEPPMETDAWLNSLGLAPKNYTVQHLSRMILQTPRRGIRTIRSKQIVPFVLRGGEGSLECGLYQEALDLGVDFEFLTKQTAADIIATGHQRIDAAAYGEVFELPDFPQDHYFYMHDDRYSPKGWYAYMVPMGGSQVEIVNCVSQPHVPKLKHYFDRLLKENSFIAKHVDGKKPLGRMAGYGSVEYPKTAKKGSSLLVGEAAGFQDVSRGFGMSYALRSGRLAALAILENLDYDVLWKKEFQNELKNDFAIRFMLSVWGDGAVEWFFRNVRDRETVDFSVMSPQGFVVNAINETAFLSEMAKRKIIGRW